MIFMIAKSYPGKVFLHKLLNMAAIHLGIRAAGQDGDRPACIAADALDKMQALVRYEASAV